MLSLKRLASLAGPVLLALCVPAPARATMQFQQVYLDQYLAHHPDRQFVAYVRTQVKCVACHQGCEDRHNRNAYGEELAKRLDALADKENVKKVLAALREVADLPADDSQPDGPTFGERMAAGKLPAGELEQLKREPGE